MQILETFDRGTLAEDELEKEFEKIWPEFNRLSDAEKLRALGLSPDDIGTENPFRARPTGEGVTGAEIAIAIGVSIAAAAAYDSLKLLLSRYLIPRLKRNRGAGAIGDRRK